MSKKSVIDFFRYDLQCPLQYQLLSWGAVSIDDKRLALRVWAHEHRRLHDGGWWVAVDRAEAPEPLNLPGTPERRMHVDALRSGLPTVAVIISAVDEASTAMDIKTYDGERLVLVEPEFQTIGNVVWARVVGTVTTPEFRKMGQSTVGALAANESPLVRGPKVALLSPGSMIAGHIRSSVVPA